MPIWSEALWLPIKKREKYGRRKVTNLALLHVDAGNAFSLRGFWDNPNSGDNGSHLHIRKDGVAEQYVDTDFIAWTQRAGSRRGVGIETQGTGYDSWTPAQRATIIRCLAWLSTVHPGIKVRLVENSRPTEHGIGYHRQGCPPNIVAGGETWGPNGKICAGPSNNTAVAGIVLAVTNALAGIINESEEDDMPTAQEIADAIWGAQFPSPAPGDNGKLVSARDLLSYVAAGHSTRVGAWDAPRFPSPIPGDGGKLVSARDLLLHTARSADATARAAGTPVPIVVDVDEAAIAQSLSQQLPALLGSLSDTDVRRIAEASNDEAARRLSRDA